MRRYLLFKPKDNNQSLLDKLDFEIQEHAKRSKILREESEKNKQKAADLAAEQMDEAAKRRLAVHLLCKQFRNNEEGTMADLEAARLQLLMQPNTPTSQTIEDVNKVLREAATEKERSTRALSRMSLITQVNTEQSIGELENYGIKEKTIDEEFKKLKGQTETLNVPKPEKPVETGFPEAPTKEREPKFVVKQEKEREKG